MCHEKCNVDACLKDGKKDGGDCECAPGCLSPLLGDGTCHDICLFEACNWDEGDCDCSPGCNPKMIGDGKCDLAECYNDAC